MQTSQLYEELPYKLVQYHKEQYLIHILFLSYVILFTTNSCPCHAYERLKTLGTDATSCLL